MIAGQAYATGFDAHERATLMPYFPKGESCSDEFIESLYEQFVEGNAVGFIRQNYLLDDGTRLSIAGTPGAVCEDDRIWGGGNCGSWVTAWTMPADGEVHKTSLSCAQHVQGYPESIPFTIIGHYHGSACFNIGAKDGAAYCAIRYTLSAGKMTFAGKSIDNGNTWVFPDTE